MSTSSTWIIITTRYIFTGRANLCTSQTQFCHTPVTIHDDNKEVSVDVHAHSTMKTVAVTLLSHYHYYYCHELVIVLSLSLSHAHTQTYNETTFLTAAMNRLKSWRNLRILTLLWGLDHRLLSSLSSCVILEQDRKYRSCETFNNMFCNIFVHLLFITVTNKLFFSCTRSKIIII